MLRYELSYCVDYTVQNNGFFSSDSMAFFRGTEKLFIILVRWNARTKAMKLREQQISAIGKTLG